MPSNRLHPHHLNDLNASGLYLDYIRQMGCESTPATSISRSVYGPRSGKTVGADGYSLPFRDLNGNPMDNGSGQPMVRYRLTRCAGDDGPKYVSPVGARNAVYLPPGLKVLLTDPEAPLIITEGEKKAAKAVQDGYAAVGITGVWNWAAEGKRREDDRVNPETPVIAELLALCHGRKVIILGDYDPKDKTRRYVKKALETLARALVVQSWATSVHFAFLPSAIEDAGAKVGLDDLLLRPGGRAELEALLEAAEPVKPGFRLVVQYANSQGHALHYLYPYQAKGDLTPPRILKQIIGKKGEGEVEVVPAEAPYVWHKKTLKVFHVIDGQAALSDPRHPMTVIDEFEALSRGGRLTFQLPAELSADVKTFASYGLRATPAGLHEVQRITEALAHAGLSSMTYATFARGWVRMGKYDDPHYLYGERVMAPPGGQPIEAVTRGAALTAAASGIGEAGCFESQRDILLAAMYNPAVLILMGFGASSLLLAHTKGMEPGIINLVGASGCGKTTLLQICASLAGVPSKPNSPDAFIGTWRTTDNGLEAPLEARNDCMVLMDEVHQAPAHTDWMSLLYMSANGRGKARMTKETDPREAKAWRAQLISSGEESLASKVRGGRFGPGQMPGGLQFRVIDLDARSADIWADVREQAELPSGGRYARILADYGAGRTGDGAITPGMIVEALERAVLANYGHVWPKLVEYLQNGENRERVQGVYDSFRLRLEALCPLDCSPIVRRRTKHIAAAMTGATLLLSLLDLEDRALLEHAFDWAVAHLWKAGLEYLSGDEGIEMADRFIERITAEPSRFYQSGVSSPYRDFWGWRLSDGRVFIPTSTGLRAIAAELGLDCDRVRSALVDQGWVSEQRRSPIGGTRMAAARGLLSPLDLFNDQSALDIA